jgi:hypothetical protein
MIGCTVRPFLLCLDDSAAHLAAAGATHTFIPLSRRAGQPSQPPFPQRFGEQGR